MRHIFYTNRVLGLLFTLFILSISAFAQSVPPPTMPTVSANTCGERILTRGNPPDGITWYWQGGFPNSTSVSNASATYTVITSGIYYLRARNAAGVWSTATGIKVDIDAVDIEANVYDKNLIQATHSVRLTNGFHVTAGNTLTVKINITEECNNTLNWSETIAYDQNGAVLSKSKSYSDAMGRTLQNQWVDIQSGKVWATQPLFNASNEPVGQTLSAPILEHDFIYKSNFVVTAENGDPYDAGYFDAPPTANNYEGERNNPYAVGDQPGTVGWYYSQQNNLEPLTPTTDFPYGRSYTPDEPDPTTSRSSAPGDAFRMGAGHETSSQRLPIGTADLDHYFKLRKHFVRTLNPYDPELSGVGRPGAELSKFQVSQNVYTTSSQDGEKLLVICNQSTSTPGVWPINGNIPVTAGQRYTYGMLARKNPNYAGVANLYVTASNGSNIVWTGPAIPSAQEEWTTVSFTVPAGVTWIRLGMLWSTPVANDNVSIAAVSLKKEIPEGLRVGYKFISTGPDYVSTDPNRLQSVSFVANDGKELATAELTANGLENWAYTYYNDIGQVVATVAPNGINTASEALPAFVTYYKYDHLGRMIETTSADEGTSRYVYSLDGKLRFSENQEQRNANPKRFSYTHYDYLGRLVESGEYTSNETNPYVFQPHTTTSPSSNSVLQNDILEKVLGAGLTMNDVNAGNAVSLLGFSAKSDSRCTDYNFITYDVPGSNFISDANHTAQSGVNLEVSKTENANATTWYSYDEFGQVAWTKQNIVGLGTKTVDYTYDYFGNVTEVAFQKAQPDAYYHHYTYDVNQRLTQVHTSADGNSKRLQATYSYYLHGPLKRMVLANNLQGIDYVYNIDGSLKSINHADPAKDPGNDGNDAFGMTLQYYDNDYQGANYSTGNQTLTAFANQYGGAIKGISWHSPVDNDQKRTYGFTYDKRYQLQNATFGNMTGTAGAYGFSAAANEAHREGVPAYDKNGNIQSLIRKGSTGNSLANYNYVYEANTNRLDKVNHNAAVMADYSYNAIGQMTSQTENGETISLSYNAYGLTKEITSSKQTVIQFTGWSQEGLSTNAFHESTSFPIICDLYEDVVLDDGLYFASKRVYKIANILKGKSYSVYYNFDVIGGIPQQFYREFHLILWKGNTKSYRRITDFEQNSTFSGTYNFVAEDDYDKIGFAALHEGIVDYTLEINQFEIRASGLPITRYTYDDRGDLVKKTAYSGADYTNTWYVRDVSGNVLGIYTNTNTDALPTIPAEKYVYGAGRIAVFKTFNNTWFYEVNDHLGNVRAVIGQPETMTVTATMETANAGTEQNQFLRYNNVRIVNAAIFDHTNQGATQNAIRLSGSANEKRGLARSFSVSTGDVVKLEVFAKYVDNNRTNVSSALNTLVNSIAWGNAAPGTVIDGGAYASNSTTALPYAGLLTTSSATGPKAYLNYLFFDRNFVFNASKSGFVPVTEAAKETGTDIPHERLFAQLNITEPGYVYAYLSNDATSPIEVYFDDFTITHEQSPIVVGADYYPYGLVMDGREIDDEPYRHDYQGQYSEKDETTGYNEFQLRFYDAKIARWLSSDPYGQYYSPYLAMGNRPNINVDPDGGFVDDILLQGMTITASRLPSVAASAAINLGSSAARSLMSGAGSFDIAKCKTCPKTANYDNYRNSNLDYGYLAELDGDGTFLRLRGITITPKSVDVEAFAKLGLRAVMLTLDAVMLGAAFEMMAMDGMATAGTYSASRMNAVKATMPRPSTSSFKNISGSLEESARLARNQPYGSNTNIFRRLPKSPQDLQALKGAQMGLGRKLNINLGDPRYAGWEKWHYSIGPKGNKSVVHYLRNPENGFLTDFKFK